MVRGSEGIVEGVARTTSHVPRATNHEPRLNEQADRLPFQAVARALAHAVSCARRRHRRGGLPDRLRDEHGGRVPRPHIPRRVDPRHARGDRHVDHLHDGVVSLDAEHAPELFAASAARVGRRHTVRDVRDFRRRHLEAEERALPRRRALRDGARRSRCRGLCRGRPDRRGALRQRPVPQDVSGGKPTSFHAARRSTGRVSRRRARALVPRPLEPDAMGRRPGRALAARHRHHRAPAHRGAFPPAAGKDADDRAARHGRRDGDHHRARAQSAARRHHQLQHGLRAAAQVGELERGRVARGNGKRRRAGGAGEQSRAARARIRRPPGTEPRAVRHQRSRRRCGVDRFARGETGRSGLLARAVGRNSATSRPIRCSWNR